MPDEIIIEGSEPWKDGAGKKHKVKIKLKKGKKKDGKKRRDNDEICITFSGEDGGEETDWTLFIVDGKAQVKEIRFRDTDWISSEENDLGGWTGVSDNFALRVHCPKKDGQGHQIDPADKPSVEIGISDEAREKLKKAAGQTKLPPLGKDGDGSVKIPISEANQTALNDYFKDGQLPKRLS
jgi:hypothetical protein